MSQTLKLMHTADCHLCEQAHDMLEHLGLEFESVDISQSEPWVERYGVRIPVLVLDEAELGWPFDLKAIQQFVGAQTR